MYCIMTHILVSKKYLSEHPYWQLNISMPKDANLIKYIGPLNSNFYQSSVVRFPLPFMGYSRKSYTAGCRILEVT